jgi:hypothetical protein
MGLKANYNTMNDPQSIDVTSTAVAVREQPQTQVAPVGLFGDQPTEVVQRATAVATALKDVIAKQGLISRISGKEYPRCEAWTLLGTMIGVFPVLVWSKPVEGGWEARVEARTLSGAIVGAAEAQCLRTERNWGNRDDFAIRSMAQTRATAKALRMPLGFVMTLAGYSATPAEEMVEEMHTPTPPTDPFKARFLTRLREMGLYASALAMFRHLEYINPTEQLEHLDESDCPKTKEDFDSMIAEIQKFAKEQDDQLPGAEVESMDADGNHLIRGYIATTNVKPTKKPNCSRYSVCITPSMNQSGGGLWLSTFKKELFDLCGPLSGKLVEAAYSKAGQFSNLEGVKEVV